MIAIRRAISADVPRIAAFNIAMAMETENLRLDPYTIEAGVKSAVDDRNKCDYWVAEIAGEVVGCTMVTHEWSDWRNGDIWWIQSVYVDPAHRRAGVFRALHQHIQQQARASGVVAIRLYVDRDNTTGKRTYEKLGLSLTHYDIMEQDLRAR